MQTGRLHRDVIAGVSAYHELDHELVSAGTQVPVGGEQERKDAKQVGSVPGVLGIIDDLIRLPRPGIGEAATEEVAAALTHTRIADVAELTVDQPCPGTVVLTGALRTRSDHDLAIAAAWSVADVRAVDDCIDAEC
jgi:BON domain